MNNSSVHKTLYLLDINLSNADWCILSILMYFYNQNLSSLLATR